MKRKFLLIPWLVILLLGSCRKKGEIQVYTIDKQEPANPHSQQNPHGRHLPPVAMPEGEADADPHMGMGVLPAPEFSDQAPAHWQAQKRTAMRMASYLVEGEEGAVADISFTSLRSVPGSLLANINRWRDQAGQAPWNEEQLRQEAGSVPSCFGPAVVVDVTGLMEKADPKQDGRILGAIAEKDGRAWFFKMRGNAPLVGREKDAFLTWVSSFKPLEEIEPMPEPVGARDVQWQLPQGWEEKAAGSSRYATIKVSGAGAEAGELVVSFFPGDVGGDVANVTRWRAQVGLPALPEQESLALISQVVAEEKIMSLVDLAGPKQRMMAAWVRHGANTWFFKWTGEADAMESLKGDFVSFLQSVRFQSAE